MDDNRLEKVSTLLDNLVTEFSRAASESLRAKNNSEADTMRRIRNMLEDINEQVIVVREARQTKSEQA